MFKNLLVLGSFFCSLFFVLGAEARKAQEGDVVQVDYTGRLSDGRVFDSSYGRQALEFILGENSMLPDFEAAIYGMKSKESKTISIPAARAYGLFDESKILKVPAAQIPSTAKLGNTLSMRTTKGVSMGRLIAIDGDDAYLDLNHFLVNQDLNFDLSLVKALKPKN
jgi:peptidylprolyl isomerase